MYMDTLRYAAYPCMPDAHLREGTVSSAALDRLTWSAEQVAEISATASLSFDSVRATIVTLLPRFANSFAADSPMLPKRSKHTGDTHDARG
jgi:hypothetical protein